MFVWVVTFTERLVTHFSGNKTHEAGGHYANDGPYLCPDTSSEKYKWRRNTLCHTRPVARLNIWGLELSLKMFALAIHIRQTNNTCFFFIFFKHLHNIWAGIRVWSSDPGSSLILMSMFVQCQCCILTSKTPGRLKFYARMFHDKRKCKMPHHKKF